MIDDSEWADSGRFLMITIRSLTKLEFMQSFQIDPNKQKHTTVRVPEENFHDISWKNDSKTMKRFLIYINDKMNFDLIILQDQNILFHQELPVLELKSITKIYYELYSESKFLSIISKRKM